MWVYIDPSSADKEVLVKISYQTETGEEYITHTTTGTAGEWVFIQTQPVTIEEGYEKLILVVANEGEGTVTYYIENIKLFIKPVAEV